MPLEKMVLSSTKLTILISWSPICMPLTLVLASMKIASTLATIIVGNPVGKAAKVGKWGKWANLTKSLDKSKRVRSQTRDNFF